MALTDKQAQAAFNPTKATKGGEEVRADGQGLSLVVTATCKAWRLKFYQPITGKRQNMSLGKYPAVTLADARTLRLDAQKLIAAGLCPLGHRKQATEKARQAALDTFKALADEWVQLKGGEWSARHSASMTARFEQHILPTLGKLPITEVMADVVQDMLDGMVRAGNIDTATRVRTTIISVMHLAVLKRKFASNPILSTSIARKHKVTHRPTVEPTELVGVLSAIDGAGMDFTTRQHLLWSLHTLARPAESCGTRWEEIDIEAATWTIPPERMKMGKQHIVPLSAEAIAILEEMRPLSGHREHVFPARGAPRNHISLCAGQRALRRSSLADRQTAHGFRALGSTTLNEAGFNPDAVEAALAHIVGGKVRASYNHATYFSERKVMMSWWSDRIAKAQAGELAELGGNVVPLRRAG